MFALLAGLGLLALVAAPGRRSGGLGDAGAEIVPREANPELPSGASEVFLVERSMYVHPAQKAAVAARADESDSRWLVVPSSGWAGAKPFATARQARTVLKAAGFKGPYGHGQASRWTR